MWGTPSLQTYRCPEHYGRAVAQPSRGPREQTGMLAEGRATDRTPRVAATEMRAPGVSAAQVVEASHDLRTLAPSPFIHVAKAGNGID